MREFVQIFLVQDDSPVIKIRANRPLVLATLLQIKPFGRKGGIATGT